MPEERRSGVGDRRQDFAERATRYVRNTFSLRHEFLRPVLSELELLEAHLREEGKLATDLASWVQRIRRTAEGTR